MPEVVVEEAQEEVGEEERECILFVSLFNESERFWPAAVQTLKVRLSFSNLPTKKSINI